jgi:hypothetical protein
MFISTDQSASPRFINVRQIKRESDHGAKRTPQIMAAKHPPDSNQNGTTYMNQSGDSLTSKNRKNCKSTLLKIIKREGCLSRKLITIDYSGTGFHNPSRTMCLKTRKRA